jgi:hypothetical protein
VEVELSSKSVKQGPSQILNAVGRRSNAKAADSTDSTDSTDSELGGAASFSSD